MASITNAKISYRDWHIPLFRDHITLGEAFASMQQLRAQQQEIPLMVQLVENPKYTMPGFTLFHGAVDLDQHDYIHIALGRGMLEKDEAFTIGFTMGTTKKVSTTEEKLYTFISQYFYPKVYQFGSDEVEVFKNAVRLGYISSCKPLDSFNFLPYLGSSLAELRHILHLEADLLLSYYKIEKKRYSKAADSARLLDL
ncbi:MAG: hypothetical protein OEZ68_13280 [Gammaproteobacteria bacterium]|nr:hypothetical protein [Gammaproteobacteria bacterium]MDH5801772.1 hypothetical protein [Gammaproteobacteria bacterium]